MASVIRSGSYPLGSDLVWLAVDSAEHVAAFITGGEGPIPANLLDRNMLIDDDVEQRILNSPAVSPARLMKELGDPMSSPLSLNLGSLFTIGLMSIELQRRKCVPTSWSLPQLTRSGSRIYRTDWLPSLQ
jgi:hypothetical protein